MATTLTAEDKKEIERQKDLTAVRRSYADLQNIKRRLRRRSLPHLLEEVNCLSIVLAKEELRIVREWRK